MSSTTTQSSSGIGLSGLLGIVFIVLKLTHVISWPWYWVLAPFWIPIVLVLLVVLVYIIVSYAKIKRKKRIQSEG